jgi:hypothetical protein
MDLPQALKPIGYSASWFSILNYTPNYTVRFSKDAGQEEVSRKYFMVPSLPFSGLRRGIYLAKCTILKRIRKLLYLIIIS